MFLLIASMLLGALKAFLVIVALLIILGLDLSKRWKLRHIPGPPALPFLGALPQILRLGSPTFFRQCREKYGPVFKAAFGRGWVVVVMDPDLSRQVGTKLLNHWLSPGILRGEFEKLDDWGLLAAKDDYWRTVRAAWQPAFSAGSLAGYLPRMAECADQLASRLEGLAEAAEERQQAAGSDPAGRSSPSASPSPPRVDIWRELGSMTLQMVGSTAYGVDFHAIEGPLSRQQQQEEADGPAGRQAAEGTSADGAADGPLRGSPSGPSTRGEAPGSTNANGGATSGRGGGGSAAQQGDHFGRVLVEACRDTFRYSSLKYGSTYTRLGILLPELRPLISQLAYALPDLGFRKLVQARTALRDASISLINSWKAAAAAAGETQAAKVEAAAAETPDAAKHAAATEARKESVPAVAPGSFLNLILSARDKATGQALTDLQVAAQVQIFLLAGYETTANALAFSVYCIATNPQVEARLLEEVDSVLGLDRTPTEADLPRLPYTEAVFNEAMRLYPPAHVTSRVTNKGPTQVGGYTVPAGVTLLLSIYGPHHDPDVWPRVEEFIPERFMPSSPLHPEVAARLPNAHSPFGYGSRMCIGWKFAVQEAKVALARLYQRLRFELEPGQVPLRTAVGMTLSPRDGVWVRPVRRRHLSRF